MIDADLTPTQKSAVTALVAADQAVKTAAAAVAEQVRAAREIGVTWKTIGEALGMIPANANRRYGAIPAGQIAAHPVRQAAVARLAVLRDERVAARVGMVEAVANARNAKVTWETMAQAVGRHKPNMYATFAPLLVEALDEASVRAWAESA